MEEYIRPERDSWFMSIAHMVALRSTCNRRKVGALLVRNNRIIATGYAGSIPGEPHCLDVGCIMEHGHCIRTIHAEVNCLLQAGVMSQGTEGAILVTTDYPCLDCVKSLTSAKVAEVLFHHSYPICPDLDFFRNKNLARKVAPLGQVYIDDFQDLCQS